MTEINPIEKSKERLPSSRGRMLYFGEWTGAEPLTLGNSELFCKLFVEMSFEAKEATHVKRWFTKVYRELVRRTEKSKSLRTLTWQERQWISNLFVSEVVARRIEVVKSQTTNKLNITPERTLREIARVAYSNLSHLEEVRKAINAGDTSKVSPEAAASVSEVIVETYTEGRGENAEEVKRVKVKGHPKNEALKMLSQIQGMYAEDNKQKVQPFVLVLGRARPEALPVDSAEIANGTSDKTD
jgi:hypothetical protein